jgi:hypothetical protein
MKEVKPIIIPVALLVLSLTAFADPANNAAGGVDSGGNAISTRILNVNAYMMAPKDTWVDITPATGPGIPEVTFEMKTPELGFRVIHLKSGDKGSKRAALALAKTNMVQAGDILLSFRPEWDGTLAYAHMQLGISHSALAFVVEENGQKFVHTLESPLNYSSPLNSSHHYGDLNAIHIVRPTKMSDTERKNLSKWARKILATRGNYDFFSDYGKPYYKRGHAGVSTPREQIIAFGKAVTRGGRFETYCSEFVWTVLGLRGCAPEAFDPTDPNCAKPIFEAPTSGALAGLVHKLGDNGTGVKNGGLIQGPEAALTSGGVDAATRLATLTTTVFQDIVTSPDQLAGRMSSGHRAVAEANKPIMDTVRSQYYGNNNEAAQAQVAAAINQKVVENFSPTAFMIWSNAKLDGFGYVGTVVFDR